MSARDALLENHTLVIRGGRIVDLLPSELAAHRYSAAVTLERSHHVLLPGLVNAHTRLIPVGASPALRSDRGSLSIAAMLRAGITCCCDVGYFPEDSARLIGDHGLRAVIGLPVADSPSAWAKDSAEYLTRALGMRDELAGHPRVSTVFALEAVARMSDATLARVATLADELDSGMLLALHESTAAIEACVAGHGVRPLERLQTLGMLTPALTAVDLLEVTATDVALAQRSGLGVVLSAEANLRSGVGAPPVTAWARSGLRMGIGTGSGVAAAVPDVWSEMKVLALVAQERNGHHVAAGHLSTWDALVAATHGGAAALGLDAQIGTLEIGKWADVCCVDLGGAAMLGAALATGTQASPRADNMAELLVFSGNRELVTDVWVAGRQLLTGGILARWDSAAFGERAAAWPAQLTGERA